jgi:hypothetical protein
MLLIDAMANLRASGCWQVASTSIFSVLCQLGRHRHALFPLLAWVADLCDGEPKAASNDVVTASSATRGSIDESFFGLD